MALTLVLALIATLMPFTSAHAAIVDPSAGGTVSGIVPIHENRGGTGPCGTPTSRIQVDRVADGQTVFAQSRNGSGAWTANWDSVGEPLGEYRLRSWTRDSVRSGFLNLGCTVQSEVLRSDLTVTLANQVVGRVTLPTSVVTGESLPVSMSVRDAATDRRIDGERDVTVSIAEVGEQELTTDADGNATTSFDLPDLPAGPLTVSVEVSGDDAFLPGSGSATTTLTRRTSQTYWQGDTRGDPGTHARLAGQIIDVTPDSDRYGQPVAGLPLELTFESDSEAVTTTSSGRAARNLLLDGPSRLAPASASFGGDDVWRSSEDEITFVVGDEASAPAETEHSTTGGLTRLLGSLLGGTTKVVVDTTTALVGTTTDVLGGILDLTGPVGSNLQDIVDLADAGLLHLLTESELRAALDLLLDELEDGINHVGDPVDDVLDQLLGELAKAGPLGELVDTVQFDWRSVYVAPDGSRQARQFGALIGVPEPLDITGDGTPDVLANLTLTTGFASLDLSGVDGLLGLNLDSNGSRDIVPRLEIARLPGAPEDLPLSIQAIVTLPGMDDEMRIGYDTRQSDAPEGFRADVLIGDDGVGLQLATRSDHPLAVTGAIVSPAATDDGPPFDDHDRGRPDFETPVQRPDVAAGEQRFGIGFDPAPRSARLAMDLGSGTDIAATFSTVEPTLVDLLLVDDGGADEVLFVTGAIDSIDGDLVLGVAGDVGGDLGVELRGDRGLDHLNIAAQDIDAGRIQQDILLNLVDAPNEIALGLDSDGTAGLTASDAIGMLEVGFASGRNIATLDDEAYLHLLSGDTTDSVAARLPGVESLTMGAGDTIGLDIQMASTPLRALVASDGMQLDASILDAPSSLRLALAADGAIEVEGSEPIDLVTVTASDPDGLILDATELDLRIEDVPGLLSITMADDGVSFDTGGDPIGMLEIAGTSGPEAVMPTEDGLNLVMTDDEFVLAGRITGLRGITAVLDGAPELGLDTVAGKVFELNINLGGNEIVAVIDHLVPNVQIRMVDDGSGSMGLEYSADEPTNSISFELGGLSASIADPLPASLEICMADDEACLPEVGIEDPGVGSIKFIASEYTTLNLTDPSGEMSANNLRLRWMELTGDLDLDDGGDLYFNTTEFGDHCPEFGCIHPVESGNINMALGAIGVNFRPGGFAASEATVSMRVNQVLGIPTGVTQTGQTGSVHCTGTTRLEASVLFITLNLTNGICANSTPIPTVADEPPAEEGGEELVEDVDAEEQSTGSAEGEVEGESSQDATSDAGADDTTSADETSGATDGGSGEDVTSDAAEGEVAQTG